MGQCLKVCKGTCWLKVVYCTAISGKIILILRLDQFSQRRKMRIEQANPMQHRAIIYDVILI